MKKIIVSIIMTIAVIASFASLASCNKNNATSDSLIGTTWTASLGDEFITITFTSETTFTIIAQDEGAGESMTSIGTYTRNGSSISLKSREFNFSGSISGNTMTLMETGYASTIIFTKA